MKPYSFINESVGEYEDYDKIIKNWFTGKFKLWWHNTKMNFKGYSSLKVLPKESKLISHILKGLNITVHAYPDADRNAFVIPGYYVGCENDLEDLYNDYVKKYKKHRYLVGGFMQLLLSKQLGQLIKMRKFNVVNDPTAKGKKCAVFKDITTPISIFVTYGMLNDATPEQRVGIYLHEIGHWIDSAKTLPDFILKHPNEESYQLYYTMVLKRYVTRYEELEADKFAKILGYGEELSSALDQIVSVRKQASWIYRIGDRMLKSCVETQNQNEEEGWTTPMDYPSMQTRKKYLKEK